MLFLKISNKSMFLKIQGTSLGATIKGLEWTLIQFHIEHLTESSALYLSNYENLTY